MSLFKGLLVVPILLLVLIGIGSADVPQLLNYQGRIVGAAGEPVADGQYAVTFSFWNAASGGTSVWSETQTGVQVSEGILNVLLGSVVPIPDTAFSAANRWLEMEVGGDVVTPRIQLTSVAYAYRIATVDGAEGGTISDPLIIVPSETGEAVRSVPGMSLAGAARVEIAFAEGTASISLFEPVDSEASLSSGGGKRVEIRNSGLVMFGATETDTTLVVAPNGDIKGVGQITMGQNSDDGYQTTVLGFQNTADGDSSTIGGGSANVTTGTISTIAGGHGNTASGEGSTVSGGSFNSASGDYATVVGGTGNSAEGFASFAAGHRAKAIHDGSFVWADHTDADFFSTTEDQFIIRASGGFGLGTDSPIGLFEVTGMDGDSSINLPMSAISAAEILDEPGIASNRTVQTFTLSQADVGMQELISVTITIPAPGYISLRASGVFEATGTSSRNQILAQISQSPGGTIDNAYAVQVGGGDHDSPNKTHYWSFAAERIYAMDAGTYAFLLEAKAHSQNDDGAVSKIQKPVITATYYPSSYGQVTALVSGSDASVFESSSYVGTPDGADGLDVSTYQVDLRELELQVLKTRLEAERAEKELLQARLR